VQDESTPDIMSVLCSLYIEVIAQKLDELKDLLSATTPDFGDITLISNQLKSSSATLGAQKLIALCDQVRQFSSIAA